MPRRHLVHGPVDLRNHRTGSALSLSTLTAVDAAVSTGHTGAEMAARPGAAPTGSAVLLASA
ncbi:hypothetical protein ACWGJB_42960 [Streptomyces sp. NPDC054813]